MQSGRPKRINAVDRIYNALRHQAIQFELKPGERMTELDLAAHFQVSRTPVREALNRLVKEGLLVCEGARGYAVRRLDPKETFDLYELRAALEVAAVRLAVERATNEECQALLKFAVEAEKSPASLRAPQILELDEAFHSRLAQLSGNAQLASALHSASERLRFVRTIDLETKPRSKSLGEHVAVARAIKNRDPQTAIRMLEGHISQRMDRLVELVRKGITRIHLSEFDRTLGQVEDRQRA